MQLIVSVRRRVLTFTALDIELLIKRSSFGLAD